MVLASDEDLVGTEVHWCWDDNSTATYDCNQAYTNWPTPQVRRCNDYNYVGILSALNWPSLTFTPGQFPAWRTKPGYDGTNVVLPDFLSVIAQNWTKQPSGAGHSDAFASKGALLDVQAMMAGTEDYPSWAAGHAVDAVSNDIQALNRDAYTNVLYGITDAYTFANIDVRGS